MTINGSLVAWIEPCGDDHYIGAFVGDGAHGQPGGRAPATQNCSSPAEAREWVEDQASALQLPVKWVNPAPRK